MKLIKTPLEIVSLKDCDKKFQSKKNHNPID